MIMPWQGKAGRGKARHGKAWRGVAGEDEKHQLTLIKKARKNENSKKGSGKG